MNRPFGPPLDYDKRIRIVPPMATVHRLADRRKPDLHALKAANDREYRVFADERDRRAWGGLGGLALTVLIVLAVALYASVGGGR